MLVYYLSKKMVSSFYRRYTGTINMKINFFIMFRRKTMRNALITLGETVNKTDCLYTCTMRFMSGYILNKLYDRNMTH